MNKWSGFFVGFAIALTAVVTLLPPAMHSASGRVSDATRDRDARAHRNGAVPSERKLADDAFAPPPRAARGGADGALHGGPGGRPGSAPASGPSSGPSVAASSPPAVEASAYPQAGGPTGAVDVAQAQRAGAPPSPASGAADRFVATDRPTAADSGAKATAPRALDGTLTSPVGEDVGAALDSTRAAADTGAPPTRFAAADMAQPGPPTAGGATTQNDGAAQTRQALDGGRRAPPDAPEPSVADVVLVAGGSDAAAVAPPEERGGSAATASPASTGPGRAPGDGAATVASAPPTDPAAAPVESAIAGATATGSGTATADAVADMPTGRQWYAFWQPFSSEISARGFRNRLERLTGLDYRVVKVESGQYHVAFGYDSEQARVRHLVAIEEATGLSLGSESF